MHQAERSALISGRSTVSRVGAKAVSTSATGSRFRPSVSCSYWPLISSHAAELVGDAVLGPGTHVRAAGSASHMSIGDSNLGVDPAATSGGFLWPSSAPLTLPLSASSVDGFVSERAPLAADVMMSPASCGSVDRTNGHPLTVADSDLRAFKVDEVQRGANEKPDLDPVTTSAVIGVPDLLEEPCWPHFRPGALRRHPPPGRGARPRPARDRDHRREGARR
jgi:hypothetical protein